MAEQLKIGETVGDYCIDGFLGAGGMGEVYSATHVKIGRRAAVKLLGSAALADPTFKARFHNEARLQANLSHPNIAALYDFQEVNDRLYIFMEYIDGETLEDVISAGPPSPGRALEVFREICSAIAYIHRNGIIHRDIKSQNVKITSAGNVKLLDFGIAKESAADHGLTQTGGVIGTPHYLAPELLDGDPASAQSDIWALGVLLFEMLTGEMPFKSDTIGSLVLQIVGGEVRFPAYFDTPDYAPAARIVRKCLRRSLNERYLSVDELISDLASETHAGVNREMNVSVDPVPSFVASEYDQTTPPAEHDAAGSLPVRSKTPLIALGAAALVVVVFAAGILGVYLTVFRTEGNLPAANPFSENKKQLPGKDAAVRKIKVDVDEGRADVLRDSVVVGKTPFELEANEGAKVALTLRRDGFQDKPVEIEVKGGKRVYTFSLKAKE